MRLTAGARALLIGVLALPLTLSTLSPASAESTLTVTPTGPVGPVAVGEPATAGFTIDPNPAGEPVQLEWVVRAGLLETDPVVRSGSDDVTPDVDGVVSLTFETPSELGEGTYGLEVAASHDVAGAGSASGASGIVPVVVDNPPTVSMSLNRPLFFPMEDDYRDLLRMTFDASEDVVVRIRIADDTGATVRTLRRVDVVAGEPAQQNWNGRGADPRKLAPAGDYTVIASATDAAGNVVEVSADVAVSLAKWRMTTTTTSHRAKKSMYDKFVGRCSKLVSPAKARGWPGSQGYYSKARCRRTANSADVVVGAHAWWVPESRNKEYGKISVEVYGGKAKKAGRGYLILGYYGATHNGFVGRTKLGPKVAWHAGESRKAKSLVRYQKGRPYLVWSVGLAEGSRYDVKKFRIKVRRVALVDEDGTVLAPRDGLGRRVTAGAPVVRSAPTGIALPS